MTETDTTSIAQDEWIEIAQRTRIELQKRMADMPVMEPGELRDFVEALSAAESFEQSSNTWDERQRDWKLRLSRGY